MESKESPFPGSVGATAKSQNRTTALARSGQERNSVNVCLRERLIGLSATGLGAKPPVTDRATYVSFPPMAVIPQHPDPPDENRATVASGGNEICAGIPANSPCQGIMTGYGEPTPEATVLISVSVPGGTTVDPRRVRCASPGFPTDHRASATLPAPASPARGRSDRGGASVHARRAGRR